MRLKKLFIENFRSFENQEITFPRGSTLLSGDIGSGKTTILLAIEFALFGLQPSQKANSLLRNGEDYGKIVLEFEIEGKEVIIQRTLKRSKKSITQDYVSLTIDNEKFEESITEIKSKILNLLNYPEEFAKKTNLLYKFTVYTPQEEMKQIILEPKDIRLNTLRHVFGIDKYKRIQENASLLNHKLREKIRINEVLFQDLKNIKEGLIEKEANLLEFRRKENIAKEEHEQTLEIVNLKEKAIKKVEEKINEKRLLESEKEKSNILISEKNQQIDSFKSDIEVLKNQLSEAEKLRFSDEEYNALDQRIEFQESKESEVRKEYMDLIGKLNSFESKKMEIDNFINKITGLEKCPTCLQEVAEEYKKNMLVNARKEIEYVLSKNKELKEKKDKLIIEIESTKNSKEAYSKRKSELDLLRVKLEGLKDKEQRITEMNNQKGLLDKDVLMLQQQILKLEKSIKDYGKFDELFEERNKELKKANLNENDASIKKVEIKKEIQFLEIRIKEDLEKIEEKEKLKKQTENLKELEDWITNKFLEIVLYTEKQVMITLKHEFSNLFSNWFSILVSESLTAKLDDDFTPLIEQKGYELDYAFLSGGERTAIALAYRLALNQVINSLLSNIKTSNLVILDEPTDGFSAQQLEKMKEVLQELNTEQLILVSHEQKMEDFVDNIIRITKRGDVSRVE